MKLHKLLLLFFMALGLSLNNANVFAQDDDDDDDDDDEEMEEMDEEEWQRQMDELNAEKSNLQARLNALNSEITGLKSSLEEKVNNGKICEAAMYAAVGNTKDGVADFRKRFEETEKKVNGKVGTPADARKMYFDDISKDKARCLPEFADRYASMKKKLEDWEGMKQPESGNTVVKGDCLWKISKMKYGSPYYWPAIWDANRNGVVNAYQLKNRRHKAVTNPNLIYPGQVLRIPALTDAQKKEAEMKSKKYRKTRVKKTDGTDVKKDEKKDVKKDEKKDTPKK
jgi:LysM repeat protein